MGSLMDHNFWVMYRSQPLLAYFKGNPLEKTRWVIKDSAVWSGLKWAVDWTPLDESILDTRPYTTTYAYDALNRVRNLAYPEDTNGQRQELTPKYNRAGSLERIELQGAPVVERVAYNAKGQRILLARANGFHTRYAYDPVTFRLKRIRTERFTQSGYTYTPQSGNVRQDTGYEYDLGGNIIKIKERITDCGINGSLLGSDALDKTFEYDPLNRLLKATGRESGNKWNGDHWAPTSAMTASPNANHVRAYTRRYSYDKVGNVQELVHQAISNNYTRVYNYTTGLNRLANISTAGSPPTVNAAFLYDANGNLVKNDTERLYEWNAADQLAYTKLQTSGAPPQIQAHYLYDAAGQRVKRLVRNGGGYLMEACVYIDGIFEHRFREGGTQQTSLLIKDGRNQIATVRAGDPLDGNIPYFTYELEDHLGSQVGRMDENGTAVDRLEYYPFGEFSLRQNPVRYGYVGKEYDFETGLNYYGARYYAAWTCRFISVDPLADKYMYLTPYNYAANDPIGDFDIDGQQNNKSAQDGGGDRMNFSDMLPKGNDTDSTKPPVVLQMEKKANGGLATGKELEAPDTVGSVEEMVQFASKKFDEAKAKAGELWDKGVETVKEAADKAKKEAFRATATGAVDALDWINDGEWSTPATDDDVNAYQLSYQWVHGTGSDQRTFTENSTMGQQMLQADYVQRAMYSAGLGSITGGNNTADATRSLRNENPALYVVDFTNDVTGANPARGFHGSINGTVTAGPAIVFSNYTALVPLTIELNDRMTATSGTRASATVGGYDIQNPTAVYKTENPYGPNGQFRTIEVTYTMRVIAVMSVPSPLRLPIR